MSTFLKLFAGLILLLGVSMAAPGEAQAQHWHGHHGGFHGYHGGYGGFGFGFGGPYAYYPPSYYYGPPAYYAPDCGWQRVRVWSHGHWRIRTVRRCW
jgi:hypothetical protein